jgi:hypothetical protein
MVRMPIIGDRRSRSRSLAMLAAMRRASSRVVSLVVGGGLRHSSLGNHADDHCRSRYSATRNMPDTGLVGIHHERTAFPQSSTRVERDFHTLRVGGLTGAWEGLDEVGVPRYFFARWWPDGRKQNDPDGTILPNEAAALSYAERIVESLRKESGYNNPGLMMFVRNERQQIVLSIPFLPACA